MQMSGSLVCVLPGLSLTCVINFENKLVIKYYIDSESGKGAN